MLGKIPLDIEIIFKTENRFHVKNGAKIWCKDIIASIVEFKRKVK